MGVLLLWATWQVTLLVDLIRVQGSCWPFLHQCSLPLSLIHYPYIPSLWPQCHHGHIDIPRPLRWFPPARRVGISTTQIITWVIKCGLPFRYIDQQWDQPVFHLPSWQTILEAGQGTGHEGPWIRSNDEERKAKVRPVMLQQHNPAVCPIILLIIIITKICPAV